MTSKPKACTTLSAPTITVSVDTRMRIGSLRMKIENEVEGLLNHYT